MLKKLILVMILSTFTTAAFSQVMVGVKGGLNYVNVIEKIQNPHPLIEYDRNSFRYRPAFHFGIYGILPIAEKLTLNQELIYSQKGAKRNAGTGHKTYFFHYLNMPVMLKYEPIKNLSFLAGPELGMLINASVKTGPSNTQLDPYLVNPWEIGAAFGVRFGLSEKVKAELRYIYSFNSALPDTEVLYTDSNGQSHHNSTFLYKNSTFQLSLLYQLWGGPSEN